MRQLAFIAIVLFLSGCGSILGDINQSKINKLQVGMTTEEVVAVMGKPEKREAYGKTEFLLYRTSPNVYDELGLTPVAIEGGKVVGWGRNYYAQITKADITVRQR